MTLESVVHSIEVGRAVWADSEDPELPDCERGDHQRGNMLFSKERKSGQPWYWRMCLLYSSTDFSQLSLFQSGRWSHAPHPLLMSTGSGSGRQAR
jgi:hypothetical protein